MGKNFYVLAAVAVFCVPSNAGSSDAVPRSPSASGAALVILQPADGATVKNPVTVIFGLDGMGVAPAGVPAPLTGHHHLIVDAELPASDRPIPADENHRHFGGGQTQVDLELSPGRHTLQLVLGDHNHVPHDPPVVSKPIEITVE